MGQQKEHPVKHTEQFKWRVIIMAVAYTFGIRYLNMFMFDGASVAHFLLAIIIMALGYFYFGRLVTEKEKEIDELINKNKNETN